MDVVVTPAKCVNSMNGWVERPLQCRCAKEREAISLAWFEEESRCWRRRVERQP